MRWLFLIVLLSLSVLPVCLTYALNRLLPTFERPDPFVERVSRMRQEASAEHDRMVKEGRSAEERARYIKQKGQEIHRWCAEQGRRYPGE